MFKNPLVKGLWAKTRPKIWEGEYWMISFPTSKNELVVNIISEAFRSGHYQSLISDHHEISIILHAEIWENHKYQHHHHKVYGPLSGITFDLPLDIEVFGYLNPMVELMAINHVSIVPQCALVYDHIFVNTRDLSLAISSINTLCGYALEE
jgi:hypothetical protein